MHISYRQPADRGVTTLMYVGDDDAVDKALTSPTKQQLIVGAIAALVAIKGSGIIRIAGGCVAGYVGYRFYKSTR